MANLTRWGSWITIEERTMAENEFAAVTPGEMLKEEFLLPLKMSQYRLAKEIGVPVNAINVAFGRASRRYFA